MGSHLNFVSPWRTADSIVALAEPGDLIECGRGSYEHWVVYIGNGSVAHLADPSFSQRTSALITTIHAEVSVDGLIDVSRDDHCRINNSYDHRFSPLATQRIVERALTAQGPQHYSLHSLNCEHFATWCRYGRFLSKQVEEVSDWMKVIGAALLSGVVAAGALATIRAVRRS